MSIGSGSIRPCSQAFGTDQFDKHDNNPRNQRHLQTFFKWYYSLIGVCMVLASTVILYVQEKMGWKVGVRSHARELGAGKQSWPMRGVQKNPEADARESGGSHCGKEHRLAGAKKKRGCLRPTRDLPKVVALEEEAS